MTAKRSRIATEPPLVRWILVGVVLAFLGVFVLVPLGTVFALALSKGLLAYGRALVDPATRAALSLTVTAAGIAVPVNLVFGLLAAWLLAKFQFRGRSALITLIDLPFSVSPVVAGLTFVLLFGRAGFFGPFLLAHDVKIIFAVPGIVLATLFVTVPFIVREVLPIMQAQGNSEEEAAMTLGAGGFTTFFRVTLPKIKWGVLYGVVLANARAMGEFGAVSVVSGHIRGVTTTLPLHAEILYNEYDFVGAFAVASILSFLSLVTLVTKKVIAWRTA